MDVVQVVISAVAAGLLAAGFGPVVRALPEPADPAPDKRAYADLVTMRSQVGVPVVAAALAGVVAARIDHPELLPIWVALCGVGAWLAYIDAVTQYLPYALVSLLYVATLVLVSLGALLLRDVDVLVRALVVNVIFYLVYRLLHLIARFGYGDVTFSGVLGLALGVLGLSESVVGGYLPILLSAAGSVVLMVRHRRMKDVQFAFGPYMLVGAVIAAGWGPALYAT